MKCSPRELTGISKSPLAGVKYFHKEVQAQGGPGRAREPTSTLRVHLLLGLRPLNQV